MDKQEVIKNLSAIYYTLNEVEIKGVQNVMHVTNIFGALKNICLLYTSPSPRDRG